MRVGIVKFRSAFGRLHGLHEHGRHDFARGRVGVIPPVVEFAVGEHDFGEIGRLLARPVGEVLPELDFAVRVAPAVLHHVLEDVGLRNRLCRAVAVVVDA